MGELFAVMTSEQLDTAYTGCDLWARAAKAAGDPRTLEELRVAAIVHWAATFMRGGNPDAYGPPTGPLAPTGNAPTGNATTSDADARRRATADGSPRTTRNPTRSRRTTRALGRGRRRGTVGRPRCMRSGI